MEKQQPCFALLGLDIGSVNTRASFFGITEGKYRLQGCEIATTSLGHGLHLGAGAGEAMRLLQQQSNHAIMNPGGKLIMPVDRLGYGVDGVAVTTSAGPLLRTALLGLTQKGSLDAGSALVDSLPLKLMAAYGLADLGDEPAVIDALVQTLPEIIILTGGEDSGAECSVLRWVEVTRLVCQLLPASMRPVVVYAGNPLLEDIVRRRLELLSTLKVIPNLQPEFGEMDLIPAQSVLENEILQAWKTQIPSLAELHGLSKNMLGTKGFTLDRMVRYLSHPKHNPSAGSQKSGVLAVDLGGGSTIISAGLDAQSGTVRLSPQLDGTFEGHNEKALLRVHQWTAAMVSLQEVNQYLGNQHLHPSLVPETVTELALSQALARVQLQQAVEKLSINHPWFPYASEKGVTGHFEPVIASGGILTQAPTPGQTMLMLLDGLQPWGVTTMVLDRHHILPLLGVIGALEPVLAVHVLESDAFENLGSVIVPVSDVSEGDTVLTVRVNTDSGKEYSVDIEQGTLRRLIIPAGVSAVLELEPNRRTDVGFGERGKGGRLKVTGGALGVVIDARGRPLQLPDDDEVRVELLRKWLWTLGG